MSLISPGNAGFDVRPNCLRSYTDPGSAGVRSAVIAQYVTMKRVFTSRQRERSYTGLPEDRQVVTKVKFRTNKKPQPEELIGAIDEE